MLLRALAEHEAGGVELLARLRGLVDELPGLCTNAQGTGLLLSLDIDPDPTTGLRISRIPPVPALPDWPDNPPSDAKHALGRALFSGASTRW